MHEILFSDKEQVSGLHERPAQGRGRAVSSRIYDNVSMIMDGMLSNISQRLHEVNTLLATYGQGVLSFEQVLPPSLFYQDFNDTNLLVKEAACLVKENPVQLLDLSS